MDIKFEHVYKSFQNQVLLSDFSHSFTWEGCMALMGPSGIGKTTILRLISGLSKPDSGRILGVPERFSYMFQENRLLPFKNALENVSLASNTKRAKFYLQKLELENAMYSMPNELSGGMQRRVALARTLAFESDLILLDEPFKGMDMVLREQVMELLKEEQEKRPILLVTHDIQEVDYLHATRCVLQDVPISVVGI